MDMWILPNENYLQRCNSLSHIMYWQHETEEKKLVQLFIWGFFCVGNYFTFLLHF